MLSNFTLDIPAFRTPRLNLRALNLDDVDPLFNILRIPGVLSYFPNPDPPEIDRVKKLIESQLDHWQARGYGWWAVELKAVGQMIGWSGLQYLPETDEIEIGYLLGKPHWGKGLATEAAQVGLDFGFNELNLKEIIGIVHPENIPSQRVLEKIGLHFIKQTEYFGMKCFKYKIEHTSPRET